MVDEPLGRQYRNTVLDGILRPLKDRALSPMVALAARRVSPFVVTWTAFLFGLATAGCAYLGSVWWSLGFWLACRILDGLDGAIARKAGAQTDYGGYLDMVLDIIVYTAVPLSLAFGDGTVPAFAAVAVLMGAFYINVGSWMYLSALLEKRMAAGSTSTSVVMPSGIVEGSETVFLYSVFLVFPQFLVYLSLGMAGLTLVTAFQRLFVARRLLRGSSP